MENFTYQDLVKRYGNTQAFDLLLTIERLAKIRAAIDHVDEDQRLKKALDALNTVDFAA